jgi:signal transduction histidine kinase
VNSPFLSGVFGAWTAVQLVVGVFFLQVFAARRSELEYLLFGFVCFALAITDAGLTLGAAMHGIAWWPAAAAMINVGAIAATVLNLHFVLRFVAPGRVRRVVPLAYAVSLPYAVVLATRVGWVPGTVHVVQSEVLGAALNHVIAKPTVLAVTGYAVLIAWGAAAFAALAAAHRRGRRDVRGALIGLSLVILFAMTDVVTIGFQLATPVLFPYGFLLYGFGVADTLLVRYRRAADDLETTAKDLRHATDELTHSYLELSVVQEELFRKRQLASVGELAASIAHEVRNPLAIIVNAAASLKRAGLGVEDKSTLFGIIEEEISRLNKIVTELLRYARPMNVRRADVSLADALQGLGEGSVEGHSLDVQIAAGLEGEAVWADPALLRLALQSLIDNARQAMPGGGVIVVTASRDSVAGHAGVRLEVVDVGHGMDSRTARRAMDPFFSTRPSGTGLGLPIAGRIVEAHGGSLDVTSRLGEGTTVSMFLPDKRPERGSESRVPADPRA